MREGLMMDDYQLTLTAVAERCEQLNGDEEVVFRRPDKSVGRTTLGDCAQRARRIAAALKELGIESGDAVATLMWNQPEHLELYLALPAMGAVIHTLNPRLHADEIGFIANDAEDRAILLDGSLLKIYETFADKHSFAHVIVVRRDDEPLPEGMLDYEELIAGAEPMQWPEADERQAAAICYTSGTTGRPKGVVYSHRALFLHSLSIALPDVKGISRHDTVLPVVPMFHANAWGLAFTIAMIGCRSVLPGPNLDPVSLLDLIAEEKVTMSAAVPTIWNGVLQALDSEPDRWDISRMTHVIIGGSAAPRSMMEGFDRHGVLVVHAWGMTETSPLGSVCRLPRDLDDAPSDEQYRYRARQGIPTPLVEIRARGEEGELVPWDDTALGELEVRGPWVARSYLGGVGEDRFTDDGWFKTGDVVALDHHGNIRIADRSKDLVKSGGEWISSVDLENKLMGHPAVSEAAVIAIPDERWGERPLAAIVLADGKSADADELREHLATEYAKWQLPERFEFIDEIPRTATGKFKKTTLREQFAPQEASAAGD